MISQALLDCSRFIVKYYAISWALIPTLRGAWLDSYTEILILLSGRHV